MRRGDASHSRLLQLRFLFLGWSWCELRVQGDGSNSVARIKFGDSFLESLKDSRVGIKRAAPRASSGVSFNQNGFASY